MRNDLFKVESIDTTLRSKRKLFVDLPFKLSKNYSQWNPGLRMYYDQVINPEKNPFWKTIKAAFFISTKNEEVVGRICVMAPGYIKEFPGASIIAFPDFIEDLQVFSNLINNAEEQAKEWGSGLLIGPLNPNIHYDVGVQIQGHEKSNSIFMGYQPPYYSRCFEQYGFNKLSDFTAWELYKDNFSSGNKLDHLVDKVLSNKDIRIRGINMNEFDKELHLFHKLYADSFANHWGFTAPGWEEFKFIGSDMRYVLKSNLALIAEYKGQPVGFVLAIPNLNTLFKKSFSGNLSISLITSLLFNYHKIETVRVMIAGVLPGFRNLGIHLPLFQQIARNIFELGYSGGEISWVKDDNASMNKVLGLLGAKKTKSYRLYSRVIP